MNFGSFQIICLATTVFQGQRSWKVSVFSLSSSHRVCTSPYTYRRIRYPAQGDSDVTSRFAVAHNDDVSASCILELQELRSVAHFPSRSDESFVPGVSWDEAVGEGSVGNDEDVECPGLFSRSIRHCSLAVRVTAARNRSGGLRFDALCRASSLDSPPVSLLVLLCRNNFGVELDVLSKIKFVDKVFQVSLHLSPRWPCRVTVWHRHLGSGRAFTRVASSARDGRMSVMIRMDQERLLVVCSLQVVYSVVKGGEQSAPRKSYCPCPCIVARLALTSVFGILSGHARISA